MTKKQQILESLEQLKREQSPYLRSKARPLLDQLAALDDPFANVEWIGTERLGRKEIRIDCPSYDDMGDDSDP